MKRFYLLVLVLLLVVSVLSVDVVLASDHLAQKNIEVRVNVPVMQKFKVINPIKINSAEFQAGSQYGQVYIQENAAKARIMSNTNWVLQVKNHVQSNMDIYLRRSNVLNSEWKLISESGNTFSGKNGSTIVSFDVKVVKNGSTPGLNKGKNPIQLSYTLTGN